MKTLIVSFAIWVFVVPAVVTVFLIFTFLAVRGPDLLFHFCGARSGLFHSGHGSGTFLA